MKYQRNRHFFNLRIEAAGLAVLSIMTVLAQVLIGQGMIGFFLGLTILLYFVYAIERV